MSTHICVYFDDGGPEPACLCGDAVVLLTDEDGMEVLVVLDAADASAVQEAVELEDLLVPA